MSEEDLRAIGWGHPLYDTAGTPAVKAAYEHADSMVPKADAISPSAGYAWHGWALREAFLHGVNWERERAAKER